MVLRSINWAKSWVGAGAVIVGCGGLAVGQTLPIAGNPQQAATEVRDAIRGVREQDDAAARTAAALNRDARQEARQAVNSVNRPGSDDAQLRRDAQGDLRNMAAMNSGLRGTDLGLWFNTRPGLNGLVIADVATQGIFANAGFHANDRIVSINGRPIATEAQFVQSLTSPTAGQTASIVIDRHGVAQTLSVQPSQIAQAVAALNPPVQAGASASAPNNFRATANVGQTQGIQSTGANTVNQVDQSGLNIRGTVSPATSNTIGTTVPAASASQTIIPGAQNSSTPFAPAGPTNASALGTPGPTLSTSPGVLSANQSAPTGFSTATPGFTGPSQLPAASAGAGGIGNSTPTVGGTGVGGLGTSGLSPANPAQTAIGTAGAAGATGTTGGTGSTAGGIGAVGGTGAMIGGTGSTAGPSGGSSAVGGSVGGASGAASGAGGAAGGGAAGGGAGAGGT